MRQTTRRFTERYRGEDASDAFKVGASISRSTYGMGKGNLCDKSYFIIIEQSSTIVHDDDVWEQRIPIEVFDPFGPAGCIHLGGGNYIFFGYGPIEIGG